MREPFDTADLRRQAQRRLPRFVFDFIDGGAGDERAMARNRAALDRIGLVPRILSLPAPPATATTLLGLSHAAPLGIAPMGLADLAWPGADLGMAHAAAEARVPCGVSMLASTDIAQVAAVAGPRAWLQLYPGMADALIDGLIDRAARAAVTTLILTVDANHPGRRLRDRRNGFPAGLRTPRALLDLIRHPRWALASACAGTPRPVHLDAALDATAASPPLAQIIASMAAAALDWTILDRLRARWRNALIVKGILHPDDALTAISHGADAVWVSNHGGRQLSSVASPIELLPAIRAAVGPDYPLLIDSGIRSGEDIARAIALGADFAMIGRPFLFAAAALGPANGPRRLVAMLRDELAGALAQLGCASVAALREIETVQG